MIDFANTAPASSPSPRIKLNNSSAGFGAGSFTNLIAVEVSASPAGLSA
jgi:hypothetical protein